MISINSNNTDPLNLIGKTQAYINQLQANQEVS